MENIVKAHIIVSRLAGASRAHKQRMPRGIYWGGLLYMQSKNFTDPYVDKLLTKVIKSTNARTEGQGLNNSNHCGRLNL